MKILILLLILVTNLGYSQSGWVLQTNPIKGRITDLQFINPKTGFISADTNGQVAKTLNGGKSWEMIPVGFNIDIRNIKFLNDKTGWVSGYKYIGSKKGRYVIYIFKTTNGGKIWSEFSSPGNNSGAEIYILNKDTILISYSGSSGFISEGSIEYSFDAGRNFKTALKDQFSFNNINFLNNRTGWTIGYYYDDSGGNESVVYKTEDTGINWNLFYKSSWYHEIKDSNNNKPKLNEDSLRIQMFRSDLGDILFLNEKTGFLCGGNGNYAKTTNGGINWLYSNFSRWFNLNSICFINEKVGFMGGNFDYPGNEISSLVKTTDGGESWDYIKDLPLKYIQKIFFINDKIGWAFNSKGFMKTETDGTN